MIGPLRSRAARTAAAVGVVGVFATGCGFNGAYSLPLPGGASHGKQVIVTAAFRDVQDLVPDSSVRVDDVAVGDVKSITLNPKTLQAEVELSINAPVAANLPHNAVATLEQTSLLGEKFVALSAPAHGATGQLTGGETLNSTSTLPDVEQVFGVLSAVLNGGDLQDLQTINVELTKALSGRESQVRGALTQITKFVTDLNGQRQQIVHALAELSQLSQTLNHQKGRIDTALTQLSPGLAVLTKNTPQFVSLLHGLARFGNVTKHLIEASKANTVANLRALQPTLQHLAAAGSNLPHALEILVTYPFPHNDGDDTPGDFTNLDASFCATASLTKCTQPGLNLQGSSPLSPICSLLGSIGLGPVDKVCPTSVVPMKKNKTTTKLPTVKQPSRTKPPVGTSSPPVTLPSLPVPAPSKILGQIGKLTKKLAGGGLLFGKHALSQGEKTLLHQIHTLLGEKHGRHRLQTLVRGNKGLQRHLLKLLGRNNKLSHRLLKLLGGKRAVIGKHSLFGGKHGLLDGKHGLLSGGHGGLGGKHGILSKHGVLGKHGLLGGSGGGGL